MWKVCPVCKEEFCASSKTRVYCSVTCRAKALGNGGGGRRRRVAEAAMRKCHDCGWPTTDYWCWTCKQKRARKYGFAADDWHETE